MNTLTSCDPRPLEETDPWLAEQIRQISNKIHPTVRGYSRTRMTSTYFMKSGRIRRFDYSVGRNDPCPCGSGKKFKKCCMI